MNPSEMTDEQLNQAILEKLGWIGVKIIDGILWGIRPTGLLTYEGHEIPPNYPGDNNAALRLLNGFEFYSLRVDKISDRERGRPDLHKVILKIGCKEHKSNYCKSLTRAICEAYLTARRNDGNFF